LYQALIGRSFGATATILLTIGIRAQVMGSNPSFALGGLLQGVCPWSPCAMQRNSWVRDKA